MPQKRNPGILNSTRRDASTAIALALGPVIRTHNITPGMSDSKEVKDSTEMIDSAIKFLRGWDTVLNSLVVSPERALEELNSDWTASQEVADVLMRKYKLPFRVGHHFASDLVTYARTNNLKPLDFPYREAQRIYQESVKGYSHIATLPLSEEEFRAALNPVAIINNRVTAGGPQPAEMARMLKLANKKLADQNEWIKGRKSKIDASLAALDRDFEKLRGGNQ